MVDPRIYRLAFAPALVALVILMFSVEPIPEPVQAPETFAADFDGRAAAATARDLVELAPSRSPGSEGDNAVADEVAEAFGEVEAGKVGGQTFEGSFDGQDVELRNVLLTLPGNSSRTIVMAAGRDSARGSGATSSAAATAVLLEMAEQLGRTSHEKTIVLVSAGGTSEGASGIREFMASYPTPELVDAVVVISEPGVEPPTLPHVLQWASDSESTSAQLVESAKLAVAEEAGRAAGQGGFLGGLFRLAFPSGLGPEAPAIAEGLDAVAISAGGERLPDPADDAVASLSARSMADFGNAILALVLALDAYGEPLEHGPGTHLTIAGNLIPGWALAVLAFTLLLPALVASVDGMARASRRRQPALRSLAWALSRSVPFLAALALAYLLAIVGIAPDPEFPFDPAVYGFGWRAAGVLLALAATAVVVAILIRPAAAPKAAARETFATALGVVASLGAVGIWLVNPYLGLLCVPLAHVWLLGARPATPASTAATLLAAVVALAPVLAALVHLAERLELGADSPWILLLFVTGGQIGFVEAVLGCVLAGTILGLAALALPRRRAAPPGPGNPLIAPTPRPPVESR